MAYHYKDYGLDTVLVPTCTLGYSSRSCDKGSPNYHKEISMFSDWFHPSPQLHLMIGQAMLAIFNAPERTQGLEDILKYVPQSAL